MSTSFKDNTNYSQTIDYVYPDGEISLTNIKNFFTENGLTVNKNFMTIMKENYGTPLNKKTLKTRDLNTKFDDEKIKQIVELSYSSDLSVTDIEKIYDSIKKIDSVITESDINNYITKKKLNTISSFADYILTLLKNG